MPNNLDLLAAQGLFDLPDPMATQSPKMASPEEDMDAQIAAMQLAASKQTKPQPQKKPPQMMAAPEEASTNQMLKELLASRAKKMTLDEQGIADQRAQLQKLLNGAQGFDASPLLAWVDASTGSNIAQSYKKPMSADERAKTAAQLQNSINERQAGMAKQDTDLLKAMLVAKNNGEYRNRALDIREAMLGLATDRAARQVADQFNKDKILIDATQRKNQIGIDSHTLEGTKVINNATAAELARGIAKAISGAGNAGWHEVEMQIPKSMQGKLAQFASYWDANPRNVLSPQQRQYMVEMLRRIESAYEQVQARRAGEIKNGLHYQNPHLQGTLENKAATYLPKEQPAGSHQDELAELEALRNRYGRK